MGKLLVTVAIAAALAVPAASAKDSTLTSLRAHAHAGITCASTVQAGPLPVWARAGFQSPTARVPHVLGRSGAIVAILFKYPLQAPPPSGQNDKILWVSRLPYTWRATLRIAAQRMTGTQPVGSHVRTNIKGGPGPSLVNLTVPAAGAFPSAGPATQTPSTSNTNHDADPRPEACARDERVLDLGRKGTRSGSVV